MSSATIISFQANRLYSLRSDDDSETRSTGAGETATRSQWPAYCASAVYAVIVGITISRHEPWADEAQAWLLARDASLVDLWSRLLHYEGSPGLWHTLLHVLIRLGMPYGGLNIVSGIFGLAAIWFLVTRAPLPVLIRMCLPFTFFLCYQYAVVARSYSLLPVLLFGCAIIYKKATRRLGLFTTLLLLIAAVSMQGFVISVAIAIAFGVSNARVELDRKKLASATVVYSVGLVFLAVCAWPAVDASPVNHANYSLWHLLQVSGYSLRDAFTGQWIASLLVLILSLPFLWRGGGLAVFILSTAGLCAFGSIIYMQVWHLGLLLLVWLFAVWISAASTKPSASLFAAFVIVIAFQGYWAIRSIGYDWVYAYSGSLEAARYLRATGISKRPVMGIGFSSTAIQPYFTGNFFTNVGRGKSGPAFWMWSSRNHVNEPSPLFSSRRPEYVIVGYKDLAERTRWAKMVNMGGYQPVQHFDGNLFWRARILEPEAFDLYKRGTEIDASSMSSIIKMEDPTTEKQLISGFFDLEENRWRWTGSAFSAILKAPDGLQQNGVKLVLNLFVPASQIQKLGAMTLSVDVDGDSLKPETFTTAGEYTFSRDVQPTAKSSGVLPVNFSFDKTAPPSGPDARELGAIITSISIQ